MANPTDHPPLPARPERKPYPTGRHMSRNVLPPPGGNRPESDLDFTGRIARDWVTHRTPAEVNSNRDAERLAKTSGPIAPLSQRGLGRWFNREIEMERAAKTKSPSSSRGMKGRR